MPSASNEISGELPSTRVRIGTVILVLLGLIPAALMLVSITAHWVPLPYWDEWFTPGKQFTEWCRGTLTFRDLVVQHNESRKFFPRLIYFALMKLHGWDVRDAMALTLVSVCAMSALLYRLFRLTAATTLTATLAWTVTSFLCFSPVQQENFLWGLAFELFFTGLALLIAIQINLSTLSLRGKVLALVPLAFVATYTFANGMIVWLLAFPLLPAGQRRPNRQEWLWYFTYAVCGVLAIGAYFVGYKRPVEHPPLVVGASHVFDLLHYFVLWVGAYFRSAAVGALVAGSVAVGAFLGMMMFAGAHVWQTRDWRWFYATFVLAAYAVISGVTTAVGRLGFGLSQALESRYTIFSLQFYLALVCGFVALHSRLRMRGEAKARRIVARAAILLLACAAIAWVETYQAARTRLPGLYERNRRLLRAVEWIDVIPDNTDLALVFPHVPILKERLHTLAANRVLRLPFVGGALATKVRQVPQPQDYRHGCIDSAEVSPNQALVVSGWAWLPEKNRAPDCLVIGATRPDGTFQLFCVTETNRSRSDLPKVFANAKMSKAGFQSVSKLSAPSTGRAEIGIWAIDLEAGAAYPVKGGPMLRVLNL